MLKTVGVFALLLAAVTAQAQYPRLGQSAPGGANTGAIGGDVGGQPTLNSGGGFNSGPSGTRAARPIFMAGKVVMASGETPFEPVEIKRVCGTQPFVEGYTNSKGEFSFQVGGNTSFAVMDATVGTSAPGMPQGSASTVFSGAGDETGLGVDLTGCHLEADMPGYQSTVITLGRRRFSDDPDVGTITLSAFATSRGQSNAVVAASSLAAPKKAKSALEKAAKELNKGPEADLAKALKELDKAVAEYPAYAAAWAWMGETKQKMGDANGAMEAFEKSLAADPSYLRPYEPIVLASVRQQDWVRAGELSDAYLNLNPSNVKLRWLNAVAHFELGNHDEALAGLDTVQQDEAGSTAYPQTRHIRALILAQRGQFAEAVAELEQFLEVAPEAPAAQGIRDQIQDWKARGLV